MGTGASADRARSSTRTLSRLPRELLGVVASYLPVEDLCCPDTEAWFGAQWSACLASGVRRLATLDSYDRVRFLVLGSTSLALAECLAAAGVSELRADANVWVLLSHPEDARAWGRLASQLGGACALNFAVVPCPFQDKFTVTADFWKVANAQPREVEAEGDCKRPALAFGDDPWSSSCGAVWWVDRGWETCYGDVEDFWRRSSTTGESLSKSASYDAAGDGCLPQVQRRPLDDVLGPVFEEAHHSARHLAREHTFSTMSLV